MLSVGIGVADLSDKTVLVTGSTDGLGRETARELARRGATVLVHGRDAGRVNEVNEEIRRETGNEDVASYVADLSSLDEVRGLADDVERGVEGVTVNALHPATLMDTKMVRETFGRTRSTVEEGVEATVRLVTDPNLEGVSGRYFDGLEESRADEQAYDPSARARLWEAGERLTGR